MKVLAHAAAALALALAALGCGYSSGIRVADRVRGVHVAVFQNDTFERDVERPIHDEITRALRGLTDVPLESQATAPVTLRGRVVQFRRRGGIRTRENQLLETGIYVEIEAGLVDRDTDRPMGPLQTASVWVGYLVDDPDNEGVARTRAYRYVAEEIVLDLFGPLD